MTSSVNQQTIATRLNVSVATVSKALRDATDVSEATRVRVIETAKEMGYQGIKARQSSEVPVNEHCFVGVICRSYTEGGIWGHGTYFGGIREVSAKLNVSLVAQEVLFSHDDMEAFEPGNQPPAMRNNELAGYIVAGEWSPAFMRRLMASAPCVVIPYTIPGIQVDQVGLDHTGAVSEMAQHLYDLGHRRIAYVGRCGAMTWGTERFAGYVNAISQLGLAYRPEDVFDVEQEQMLNEGHEPFWVDLVDRVETAIKQGVTAVMCSSDWPGNQIHRGLAARGYRVPQDISITGFDDTEPVTFGMPPLTTFRLPRAEMGESALKRLMYRINKPEAAVRRVLFPCELIDHGTTAVPAPSAATPGHRAAAG